MSATLPMRIARRLQPWFGHDPLSTLREEVDDLFGRFLPEEGKDWWAGAFLPSLDMSESPEAIELLMDLPGMKPEEVTIEIRGNMLRISGERKEEKEENEKSYHRVERRTGSFSRTVMLPCAVNENEVKAEFDKGVLEITLPKAETARTHKIEVKPMPEVKN